MSQPRASRADSGAPRHRQTRDPDAILNKRGPLDDHEWAFIKQHTMIGERILAAAPALADVATIVRSSHEPWDGTGYPDGLTGNETPLALESSLSATPTTQ
jgi:HD-GYP domain-containing protein (c-di-GMP phosphodiesterase class II)